MTSTMNTDPSAAVPTGLVIDHLGVVVRDLAREVDKWRRQGFSVSDPVPLMGRRPDGQLAPLGQSSAHVVFENGYLELSSPQAGSGNHLEPYLAHGDGVRILVLATHDAAVARAAIAATLPQTSPVLAAERDVVIGGVAQTARFQWFPLPRNVIPDVLSAVVQHLTPALVFHASLVEHANGLRYIQRVLATGDRNRLFVPSGIASPSATTPGPQLFLSPSTEPPIVDRIVLSATELSRGHVFDLTTSRRQDPSA